MSFKFTDEQWEEATRSVRRSRPDYIDWVKFREEIEEVGREAQQLRHNRLYLGPPVEIRDRLRKVLRSISELQADMNRLPEPIRGGSPDPNLEQEGRRLQIWLDHYEQIAGPDFRGRKDPIRWRLEARLLARWITHLDEDKLSFARKPDGTPYGPLIKFLEVTLKAILGTAPGPDGIAKIIEHYRKAVRLPD